MLGIFKLAQRRKDAKRNAKILLVIVSFIVVIALQLPGLSAERIDFNYSLLGFKIEVKDLEAFAQEGKISRSLNFYLKRISPEQRDKLQEFLNQSYDVDPILVYRYSRTSVGKRLLTRIGEIIQIRHNLNGFYGLRSAVVQTAASPDGVNFINFLKQFPTNIKLNLSELLKLVKQISKTEEDTKKFIASLKSPNQINSSKSLLNNNFLDLSKQGEFTVTKETKEFYDQKRTRNLITDLYFPKEITKDIPVVIVSNGIGAKRDRFDELANYLASYGFAVVIPDHPGSDRERQQDFLKGLYKENFDATDFIDRPLDISYILDELEKINHNQLQNKLNLKQVGVFGYSIGGTTAMSLAGAEINFQQLKRDCSQKLNLANISSLYQCRALELPQIKRSLKDERVKAVFMFVPFGRSLFNQQELSKISIPTMWQVVDRDFLTSLLEEQVPMFNSLKNSEHYLVVSEKLPHSNVTLSKDQQSSQVNIYQIAKNYQNILSLVFFQNYITQNKEYRSYLSEEYLQAIDQEPYNLHLLKKVQ